MVVLNNSTRAPATPVSWVASAPTMTVLVVLLVICTFTEPPKVSVPFWSWTLMVLAPEPFAVSVKLL